MHSGKCLGYRPDGTTHPPVTLGACDGSSKWVQNATTGCIQSVSDAGMCLKVKLVTTAAAVESGHKDPCAPGNTLTVARCDLTTFKYDADKGALELDLGGAKCSAPMCAGVADGATVAEMLCSDPSASGWTWSAE